MVSPLTVVHVHDKKGATHVFEPGDTLPKWAVAAIDNPKVIGEGTATTEPAVVEPAAAPEPAAPAAATPAPAAS